MLGEERVEFLIQLARRIVETLSSSMSAAYALTPISCGREQRREKRFEVHDDSVSVGMKRSLESQLGARTINSLFAYSWFAARATPSSLRTRAEMTRAIFAAASATNGSTDA